MTTHYQSAHYSVVVTFATEFPVRSSFNRAKLIQLMVGWLRGTKYSRVLDAADAGIFEKEAPQICSASGEEIRIRELEADRDRRITGFRHDYPDEKGRTWRTEVVVGGRFDTNHALIFRLRTQCIARTPDAFLERPRKPYLVKTLLAEGFSDLDGVLQVRDAPHWLDDGDQSLSLVSQVAEGRASTHLPIIYISALGPARWSFSAQQIEKLAFDLGGVAHVVVEPHRAFSIRAHEHSEEGLARGGAVGVIMPHAGTIYQMHSVSHIRNIGEMLSNLRNFVTDTRTYMPAIGWDWTELQEGVLSKQREKERQRLNATELESIYLQEIDNLKERIQDLEEIVAQKSMQAMPRDSSDSIVSSILRDKLGAELYSGEAHDRVRYAIQISLRQAEQIGLDDRTRFLLTELLKYLPPSDGLRRLREELKRSTRDASRVATDTTSLLSQHGYRLKSENKHLRMEPDQGYGGLNSITIPKTPSEIRGLENLRKQIERTLGIAKLDD